MEIVYQKNKDKQPVYDMYQKIFEDPEPFAQYYFEEIYATNQVILAEEDNKILGMLHLNPYHIRAGKKTYTLNYIVAVAVWKEYRRRGIMAETVSYTHLEITFSKTGDILTDYDKDFQSFIYDNDQIAGAVYGLYADENIKKDDGTLVWKKDELIDQKTTTKEKEIHFTRKDMDGKETTNFYLGKYYIKEIKSCLLYTSMEDIGMWCTV